MYHQLGFWGGFSTWMPVLAALAHAGGCTSSTFSRRYLASLSMNLDGGTS